MVRFIDDYLFGLNKAANEEAWELLVFLPSSYYLIKEFRTKKHSIARAAISIGTGSLIGMLTDYLIDGGGIIVGGIIGAVPGIIDATSSTARNAVNIACSPLNIPFNRVKNKLIETAVEISDPREIFWPDYLTTIQKQSVIVDAARTNAYLMDSEKNSAVHKKEVRLERIARAIECLDDCSVKALSVSLTQDLNHQTLDALWDLIAEKGYGGSHEQLESVVEESLYNRFSQAYYTTILASEDFLSTFNSERIYRLLIESYVCSGDDESATEIAKTFPGDDRKKIEGIGPKGRFELAVAYLLFGDHTKGEEHAFKLTGHKRKKPAACTYETLLILITVYLQAGQYGSAQKCAVCLSDRSDLFMSDKISREEALQEIFQHEQKYSMNIKGLLCLRKYYSAEQRKADWGVS